MYIKLTFFTCKRKEIGKNRVKQSTAQKLKLHLARLQKTLVSAININCKFTTTESVAICELKKSISEKNIYSTSLFIHSVIILIFQNFRTFISVT